MSKVFFIMVLFGACYAVISGTEGQTSSAVLLAGSEAVETVFSLLSSFMIFGGISRILELSGATSSVVSVMKKPLRLLFGKKVDSKALGAITMNLTANMLGMGNAATPMGLKAAKLLNPQRYEAAPAALCLLLVLNSSAIEFFPATVVALRYAANSTRATAIVLPTLAATTASSIVGILLCKLCERRKHS